MENVQIIQKTNSRSSFQQKFLVNFKRYKFMYLMILPGLIYFAVFHYYPMYFLQVAFKNYNVFLGLDKSPWVGFDNFINIFKTKYFPQAFRNTVVLSLMYKAFGFPVPIILSLLLNELNKQRFKKAIQTVIYLPHFLSWVIVGGIWITLLSPDGGIVNEILKLFGVEPIFFMTQKGYIRWVLLFTHIWKNCGWGTIIYLAAISGIDQDLYEAALLDGASRFKQVIYITIPAIIPTIIVTFTLGLASILSLFEQVFIMYNPLVAEVTETIDTYVYQVGISRGEFSIGIAVGLFKSVISLALILITNKLAKKYQGYSII